MPSGVEHRHVYTVARPVGVSTSAPMPSGVEHAGAARDIARFFDLDRRDALGR